MPVLIVAISLTEKESNLKTIVITMIPLLYRTYVHFGMNEIVFPIFQDIYKKKNKEKSLNPPSNNNILTLQRNLFFIPRIFSILPFYLREQYLLKKLIFQYMIVIIEI